MIRMASVEQALALIAEQAAARLLGPETIPLAACLRPRPRRPRCRTGLPAPRRCLRHGWLRRPLRRHEAMNAELKVIGESRAGVPWSGKRRRARSRPHLHRRDHARGRRSRPHPGRHQTRRRRPRSDARLEQPKPENIRRTGLDFTKGATLVPAGHAMTEGAISLAAAGNAGHVTVRKAPRIGVLANGDELAEPAASSQTGQVVNSIQPALIALIRRWGADPRRSRRQPRRRSRRPQAPLLDPMRCHRLDRRRLRRRLRCRPHRLRRGRLHARVREGRRETRQAHLVLDTQHHARPRPPRQSRRRDGHRATLPAPPDRSRSLEPLLLEHHRNAPTRNRHSPPTGNREEYLRAVLTLDAEGRARIRAAEKQDSSLLSPFLTANALIRRPINSPAAAAGDLVDIVMLAMKWYGRPGSNRHGPYGPTDFKSGASTSSATPARPRVHAYCEPKGKPAATFCIRLPGALA